MTTREAIYKTALEHIRDGHDAYCQDCGWCGLSAELDMPYRNCPECESEATREGLESVAENYLWDAEEVQP